MFTRRIKTALGTITAVGLLGLFAVPSEVRAAITVTVTDSSGAAVGGAFVAVLNSDGDALDSAITAKDGTVSVNESGGAGLVVAAPGFQIKTSPPLRPPPKMTVSSSSTAIAGPRELPPCVTLFCIAW